MRVINWCRSITCTKWIFLVFPDFSWPCGNPDLVSKKEHTEKYFFQKQTLCKLKRVILYRWLNYISLLHASVIELICISSVKIKHLPWLAYFVHVTNLHLFTFKLWNKHFRNATLYLCCKIKNFTTKLSTLWLAVLLIVSLKYFSVFKNQILTQASLYSP